MLGEIILPAVVLDVALSDQYAYVADGEYGLRIIDISNPGASSETGFLNTEGLADEVYVSGNYAYVADNSRGLRIIDISDPTAPSEAGLFIMEGYTTDVYVLGDYAYVTVEERGLRIINISDPALPVEEGYFETGDNAEGVFVADTCVYVADSYDGLYIIRFDKPDIPDAIKGMEIAGFRLEQNYPNPFGSQTTINYQLSKPGIVEISVYNSTGQVVETLYNGFQSAGQNSVDWNIQQKGIDPGIYIYRMTVDGNAEIGKLVIF